MLNPLTRPSDAAKKTWRSPVYSFFKDNVTVEWLDNRPFHFFPCGARYCKTTLGGVRRYLDKGDEHSTANLMKHARRCFGEDAVKAAADGNTKDQNKSIFDSFARVGQEPITFCHRSLMNIEARYVSFFNFFYSPLIDWTNSAHIVKWVTQNNRPSFIVAYQEFINLVTAGRPHLSIPSHTTVN